MSTAPAKTRDLIVKMAQNKAREGKPKRSDDRRAVARAILAALKSNSEDDLTTALEALAEVGRGSDGDPDV